MNGYFQSMTESLEYRLATLRDALPDLSTGSKLKERKKEKIPQALDRLIPRRSRHPLNHSLAAGAFYWRAKIRQDQKSGGSIFSDLGCPGMNLRVQSEFDFLVFTREIRENEKKAKKVLAHASALDRLPTSLVRLQPKSNQTKPKMKTTLTTAQAAHLLIDDQNANWSYAGAFALVEHLEELEDSTGESMEFDRVAIRCDWSEYESLQSWGEDYFGNWNALCAELGDDYCGPFDNETPEDYAERFDDAIRGYITDRGQLIEFDGGIIVSSF
jgi:hypothetical protein